MDEGMNHLARVLHGRIKDSENANSDLVLDFGVIHLSHSNPEDGLPRSAATDARRHRRVVDADTVCRKKGRRYA